VELAKLLIAKGADVDVVGTDGDEPAATPLWLAVFAYVMYEASGGLELAMLLLEKGADVNAVKAGEQLGTLLWLAALAVHNGQGRFGADYSPRGAGRGRQRCRERFRITEEHPVVVGGASGVCRQSGRAGAGDAPLGGAVQVDSIKTRFGPAFSA
jgi:hypothetical protein